MATISQRIKEGMEIRGLRQADIIEKTGINKGALSSYISGRYEPKQTNIYLIARALDVNETWLMGADVPMERNVNNLGNYNQPSQRLRSDEERLLSYYNLLNEVGRDKAQDYVEDLSENPKYTEKGNEKDSSVHSA